MSESLNQAKRETMRNIVRIKLLRDGRLGVDLDCGHQLPMCKAYDALLRVSVKTAFSQKIPCPACEKLRDTSDLDFENGLSRGEILGDAMLGAFKTLDEAKDFIRDWLFNNKPKYEGHKRRWASGVHVSFWGVIGPGFGVPQERYSKEK